MQIQAGLESHFMNYEVVNINKNKYAQQNNYANFFQISRSENKSIYGKFITTFTHTQAITQ